MKKKIRKRAEWAWRWRRMRAYTISNADSSSFCVCTTCVIALVLCWKIPFCFAINVNNCQTSLAELYTTGTLSFSFLHFDWIFPFLDRFQQHRPVIDCCPHRRRKRTTEYKSIPHTLVCVALTWSKVDIPHQLPNRRPLATTNGDGSSLTGCRIDVQCHTQSDSRCNETSNKIETYTLPYYIPH